MENPEPIRGTSACMPGRLPAYDRAAAFREQDTIVQRVAGVLQLVRPQFFGKEPGCADFRHRATHIRARQLQTCDLKPQARYIGPAVDTRPELPGQMQIARGQVPILMCQRQDGIGRRVARSPSLLPMRGSTAWASDRSCR